MSFLKLFIQTSNDPADGLSITGSGVGSARTKNKRGICSIYL